MSTDVRGTRCKPGMAGLFRPCAQTGLFYPTTPSNALLTLDTLTSSSQNPIFAHPRPYLLIVRGLEHAKSSPMPRPSTTHQLGAIPSLGRRQDVFRPRSRGTAASPPARQQVDGPGGGQNETVTSAHPCDCSACMIHQPCEREVDAAREEVLLEARRNSVLRFYEQAETSVRAPAISRASSREYICNPADTPFMLFRSPPPWSALPSPLIEEGNIRKTDRKKIKLDTPLADGRALSTDGARMRAQVHAAMTALHASLKERQETLVNANSSLSFRNTTGTERKVSSNPFARTSRSMEKFPEHPEQLGTTYSVFSLW